MATTSTAPNAGASRTSARVRVQQFGTVLSNMVMPNIAAFIAWGLITALFIKDGWINMIFGMKLPNDSWVAHIGGWGVNAASCVTKVMGPDGASIALANGVQACSAYGGIVGPMITYLLPLLIGFVGGKNIYDIRGGVVGAIATMGVIAGTNVPMFMGAMIMGPLGGWTMRWLDQRWQDKIKPGFEMLINNFSAGIWGMILAIIGFFGMGPAVEAFSKGAEFVVKAIVSAGLLPLASLFIEPAKVLFLNNAINHGILTPLGTNQATATGKSILFLLEANPGPGLGLLLAFMVFGKGMAKASAGGAAVIHFLGGIHEIYFPYILAKPKLIAATILGGATGILTNVIFGSGLRAPAAPGSIIAVLIQTATDSYVGVILSVILSAAVSFAVAAFLLKTDKSTDDGDLSAATSSMEAMKGKKSSVAGALVGGGAGAGTAQAAGEVHDPIKKIVFACDAGMGSSAMGASVLRRKIRAAGFDDVSVTNKAISTLSDDIDLLVTHQDLADRAAQRTPSAVHVAVENFMDSPRYDEIVALLGEVNTPAGVTAPVNPADSAPAAAAATAATASAAAPVAAATVSPGDQVLATESIVLNGTAADREAAITEAGQLLVAAGAVEESYVDSMHEREASVSTYMGNLLAIPHGTNEAKSAIRRSAMSFVRYPDGITWKNKPVKFVVGIAGAGDDHLALLSKLAKIFVDKEQVARLENATSVEEIHKILASVSA
ncbi:MAG TPA: PTS mannitol transporter subunit IICBA [Propionibacteriaceae bacterium]|nr:PTS mannitol transporter subunit IICBA [Propionibacteriaceae bacterium]